MELRATSRQITTRFNAAIKQRGQQGRRAYALEVTVGAQHRVVTPLDKPGQLLEEERLEVLEVLDLGRGRGAEGLLQTAEIHRPGGAVRRAPVQRLLQRRHGLDVVKVNSDAPVSMGSKQPSAA